MSANRKEILETAARIICGERMDQYGRPEDSFKTIADYWSLWKGVQFTPHDVAMMMALLKVARVQTGTQKDDSYVDLCGYAAIAGEIALKGGQNHE